MVQNSRNGLVELAVRAVASMASSQLGSHLIVANTSKANRQAVAYGNPCSMRSLKLQSRSLQKSDLRSCLHHGKSPRLTSHWCTTPFQILSLQGSSVKIRCSTGISIYQPPFLSNKQAEPAGPDCASHGWASRRVCRALILGVAKLLAQHHKWARLPRYRKCLHELLRQHEG